MDILESAKNSGMQVILNGRIGREEYQSVCGSVQALQRFAEALSASAAGATRDASWELRRASHCWIARSELHCVNVRSRHCPHHENWNG